jgi:16S rRNA processing protein RimM
VAATSRDTAGLVPVATVGRAHGLRGEVYVWPFNPESDLLLGIAAVTVDGPGGARAMRRVLRARRQGAGFVLALEGIVDRDQARLLAGASLLVPRDALPNSAPDEFYDVDLVGLTARTPEGAPEGEVVGVEHLPAGDSLTLRLVDGQYVDLPLVAQFVDRIDLEAATVTVSLPEGLPRRGEP